MAVEGKGCIGVKKIIIICLLLASCRTYVRTTYVTTWVDKWNYRHRVIRYDRFLRSNDSLLSTRIDTSVTDLNETDFTRSMIEVMSRQ